MRIELIWSLQEYQFLKFSPTMIVATVHIIASFFLLVWSGKIPENGQGKPGKVYIKYF